MRKLLIALLVIMTAVTLQIPVMAETNLATKATVTASQSGADSKSTPNAVNDGKIPAEGNGSDKWFIDSNINGAWLQFQFESPVTISGATVYSGGTIAGFPDVSVGFKFQYENGGAWQDIPGSAVSDNSEHEMSVNFSSAVTSSKFRFVSTADKRFRIREIELYEFDPSAPSNSEVIITPADVKGPKYEAAVTKLLTLGLINNDNPEQFSPETPIKRSEFISWIISCIDANTQKSGEKIFFDVDPESEAGPAIEEAYRRGFIKGDGNGCFFPNDEITYDEACTILVSVLGYRPKAEIAAAYPVGFRKVAASLDLSSGVTVSEDGKLTRGDSAIMINNALKEKMIAPTVFGDNMTYNYEEGGILKAYRSILHTEGIVEATEETVVYGTAKPKSGQVIVGGEAYNKGNSAVSSMLGCYAEIYYQEINGEKTILYAEKSNRNKILEIDARDIESARFSGITYYNNDRKRSISFKNDMKFFLNGAESGISETSILPKYGRYVLIDNNGDNSYDIAMIHSQKLSVIRSVDEQNETISTDEKTFDLRAFDSYDLYKNGTRVGIGKLSVGNVAVIEESGNKELIKVYTSDKKVTGEISAVNEDKVLIGDTLYDITPECLKRISVGQSADFLTTEDDIIVDFKSAGNSFKYGYIIGVKPAGGFENMQIKVISEDGSINVYNLPDTVKVNGNSAPDKVIAEGQIIRFKANSDNKIKQIYSEVPSNGMEYADDGNEAVITFDDMRNAYYKNGTLIGGQNKKSLILKADTVIFNVPKNSDNASDRDYQAGKGLSVLTSKKYGDTFRVINLNKENVPAALCYLYATKISPLLSTTATGVVKSVGNALNKDGEPVNSIEVYINGSLSTYTENEDTEYNNEYNSFVGNKLDYRNVKISDLKPGDAIQLKADSSGDILTYRVLYKADDINVSGLLQYIGGTGEQLTYYPSLETLSGNVYDVGTDSITFMADGMKYVYKNVNYNVYVYNKERNMLYTSNKKRLVSENASGTGTRVFVRIEQKTLKDIIIYE